MKKYQKPEITIVNIKSDDVITTSGNIIKGGSTSFPDTWKNINQS